MPRLVHWRLPVILAASGWRLAIVNRLARRKTVAKVGSPDLHQAKMRFLVLVGCVLYGVSIGLFDEGLTGTQTLVFTVDAFLFGLFALHTHSHFKKNPEPEYLRRTLGLFADHGAALGCLAVTGRDAGALAWLPLFIIQGVGIRFGVRWLFASQAIGVASVAVICVVNPFFHDNATIALGAVLSVLVLPLYFALLAKREARIKAALVEARLDAEAANEAKGRFVAMISHELRTPLTGISGLNELLRKQGLPAQTQQMLAEQHAATALMLTMVNDVLDLSKIEDGQMQVQDVDFDPQELALSVLQALSFQARRKGLGVRIELDASLPATMSGSPFHVSRILQNLLGNAIKFTLQGFITLRVGRCQDLASVDGSTCVQFEVIDTGIGIPDSALPRIFDRFYQVDAAVTRRFGGTGLGTSLVKEFCDLLQGNVRIESRLGEGTRCLVSLPFRPAHELAREGANDVSGIAVAAWGDDVPGWADVRSRLLALGVTVHQVRNERVDGEDGAPTSLASSSVVLVGPTPSSKTAEAIAALGLDDTACIVFGDASEATRTSWQRVSNRLVLGVTSETHIFRALRLATAGATGSGPVAVSSGNKAKRTDSTAARAGLRVLVAEDTTTIQLFMRVTLEHAGFDVTVASDGAEALSEAAAKSFDAVVLDWNMPEVDGIEVLKELRRVDGPNLLTPVVIATAAPSQQLIDVAMSAGAQALLGKPFSGDELVNALNAVAALGGTLEGKTVSVTPAMPEHVSSDSVPVLDLEALEGPGSIFRAVDPSELLRTFMRDVEKRKAVLRKAYMEVDVVLFRDSIHSLTGYAGTFGARRLQWLLSISPRDESELQERGQLSVAELCETIDLTTSALGEWARAFTCVTH